MAGLELDPWQQFVLDQALGEKRNGKWAAFEVGLVVSRQNGKGAILEARELAGLFLLGERLLIHSAHQFDTSLEAFRRLLSLVEDHPEFSKRVKRVSRSHGEEGIELLGGQRIRFRTRTKGGGRGFSGDCLILDEAMDLPLSAHGALLPTLSARPNPQVWYTGSAVDQNVHDHGLVLANIRERGVKGNDPSLAYFEWSAAATIDTAEKVAMDKAAWAAANPGLGIRISLEHVGHEQRSMDPRTFAVERLGVGDWPSLLANAASPIDIKTWDRLEDEGSTITGPVRFAMDVKPDRSAAAIGVAGLRADKLSHVEVIDHKPGTGWVVDRLIELTRDYDTDVTIDRKGPAASLLKQLEHAGVPVNEVSYPEQAEACGMFYDAVTEAQLRHLGTPELRDAIRGAAKRALGDAWAWARKTSTVDITPLVACTLAHWAAQSQAGSVYEDRGLLTV